MSSFAVTIETIQSTRPIPEADRIEVATLAGMDFEFVIAKGQYAPGAKVIYFPVDSVLPAPLVERLGLAGKLSGKDRNRVKTVKLRGQISQGLVAGLELVPAGADAAAITSLLGVTKYEPPENIVADGILAPLPDGQGKYDIESADRYVDVAEQLLDQPVCVTEKLEGSNLWVRAEPDGTVTVGQRENAIKPKEGVTHTFRHIATRERIDELARTLAARHGATCVVYGEALGPKIQGNLYGFREFTTRLFDLRIGRAFLGPAEFLEALEAFYGSTALAVPVLQPPDGTTLREWLAGRTIKEASNGRSMLVDRAREGIVIKPLVEQWHAKVGRLYLKQRSPEYLAKSEL